MFYKMSRVFVYPQAFQILFIYEVYIWENFFFENHSETFTSSCL